MLASKIDWTRAHIIGYEGSYNPYGVGVFRPLASYANRSYIVIDPVKTEYRPMTVERVCDQWDAFTMLSMPSNLCWKDGQVLVVDQNIWKILRTHPGKIGTSQRWQEISVSDGAGKIKKLSIYLGTVLEIREVVEELITRTLGKAQAVQYRYLHSQRPSAKPLQDVYCLIYGLNSCYAHPKPCLKLQIDEYCRLFSLIINNSLNSVHSRG